MSRTFTKLFSSITESTVWCEPSGTRLVWITMLAMADHAGRVFASIPGLANRARVTVEETEVAIATFLSPDPYSRTPDNEGRRIEHIDGGWRLLNHAKYRNIRDEESIKESKRKYINARRAAEREEAAKGVDEDVDTCRTESNEVDRGRANAYAQAYAQELKATVASLPAAKGKRTDYPPEFDKLWDSYPKRGGSHSKLEALKQWQARLKQGHSADAMQLGVDAYHAHLAATGKLGTEYVKMARTFLGPNLHFLDRYAAPVEQTTAKSAMLTAIENLAFGGRDALDEAGTEHGYRPPRGALPSPHAAG